jgi:hypothetical protein
MDSACLIAASNWALVVLTLALVVVTARYAYTSRKMYLEMIEGRKQSLRPLLSIKLDSPSLEEQLQDTVHPQYINSCWVSLTNTGNSPALRLALSAEVLINGRPLTQGNHFFGVLGSAPDTRTMLLTDLMPGLEEAVSAGKNAAQRAEPNETSIASLTGDPQPCSVKLRLKADYSNSYSVQFEQQALFSLDRSVFSTGWHEEPC